MTTKLPTYISRGILRSIQDQSRLTTLRWSGCNGNVYKSRLARGTLLLSSHIQRRYASSSEHLPIIIRPSFWKSLVPKFLRKSEVEPVAKKGWNPATFFIYIFIFIGSQAIQIVSLHRAHAEFSRETETKLALLREVIRRVQNGEDVDVEEMLGTGKEKEERAWEEVIKELEREDTLIRARRKKERQKNKKDNVEEDASSP